MSKQNGIIEVFENILSKKVSGVCRKCGSGMKHNLIYCNSCGNKFYKPKTLTLRSAIKIANNAPIKNRSTCFKPYFVAAIYKLDYSLLNYNERDFSKYIIDQIIEE